MTSTVSAKIPDEMKRELEREDLNVSEVVREALEDELTRRRRERLSRDVEALRESVGGGVSSETIVKAVRETRREH
jgi:antitoxin CcdA